ncbi:MAG: hypothetical protein DMG08_03225 [Acidobacteria bacterium]|nr:MAG: hypothetical protein DMG08_03225 [Acidobacteriota bacterium]
MLTRRQLLSMTAAIAAFPGVVRGQGAVPAANYRSYSRCLPDYLRILAQRAYNLRNQEIAKLTTTAAIRDRQRWVRKTFWKLVGGTPERTPLNARTVGSFEREGYRIEKVVYESQPRFFVPANLYVPTSGRPPFPGVLFQMGHATDGKAYDLYQRCCQGLAKLGYVVLAFDPMGQGERTYYPAEEPFRTRLNADEEHTAPGRQMLLFGDTSTRMQVWDGIRSLDYLASHPMVDGSRLASTGQSGGGTTTMLLACVDDRLAAAAIVCPNTENVACANFNPPGSTDDAEQNFIGSGPIGFDRWDLLYPLAPKPLLVLVSDKDFFGTYSSNYITSGWEEFQKLRKIYETMGRGDRISWNSTPLPHGLAYAMRLQIYSWLGRWLKGEARAVEEEPQVSPEPETTLFVTASGSVVQSLQSETPFSLNKKREVGAIPVKLEELLGVERPASAVRAATLGRTRFRRTEIEAIEVPSAPRVWIPAWLFRPKETDRSKPVVVVLEPAARGQWHEGETYDRVATAGCVVCAPDLRGAGDLTPEFSRGAARYARSHNSEEEYAWASLILGKPLLGQRVTDILALVQALRARVDLAGRPLILAAKGMMTVPAIFAASLETSIGALHLAGGLISFRALVDAENYVHPFGNFVTNLLNHTDLPRLVAGIAPRHVVIAGGVDGSAKRMETSEVRRAYQEASNVEVLDEASWDSWQALKA